MSTVSPMVSWDSGGRTYKVDEGYISGREGEAQEIGWDQVVGSLSGSLGTLEGKQFSRVVRGTGRLAKSSVGKHVLRMSKGLCSTPSLTQTHAHTHACSSRPPALYSGCVTPASKEDLDRGS